MGHGRASCGAAGATRAQGAAGHPVVLALVTVAMVALALVSVALAPAMVALALVTVTRGWPTVSQ